MRKSAAFCDEKLRQLRALEGSTVREAAKALGYCTEHVRRLCDRHGIQMIVNATDLIPREIYASGRIRIQMDAITQELLREWLSYDHETGLFVWRKCLPQHAKKIGTVAGCVKGDGYLCIGFFGVNFGAHRVAWFYHYGKWPENFIDHRDGNPLNNSIINLREATPLESAHNRRANGYSFFKRDGVFRACIMVRGAKIELGSFRTAHEARSAYLSANLKYYGDFSVVHRSSGRDGPLSQGVM